MLMLAAGTAGIRETRLGGRGGGVLELSVLMLLALNALIGRGWGWCTGTVARVAGTGASVGGMDVKWAGGMVVYLS